MITRNNVRRICLQSDIKCHLARNTILIDANDFISKINPYKIDKHFYTIPKLRCINGCVKEWNKQRQKGERYIHADEIRAFLKNDQTVFKYKFGNRCIVFDFCSCFLYGLLKARFFAVVVAIKTS